MGIGGIGGPPSFREGFLQFQNDPSQSRRNVKVGNPTVPGPSMAKLSLGNQAFFLMAFIACTTSVAFTSLVIAAVLTCDLELMAASSDPEVMAARSSRCDEEPC